MADNDPRRKAAILGVVQTGLERNEGSKFPARSLNAKLIELMWSRVQQKVGVAGPLTVQAGAGCVFLKRAFDEIPQSVVDKLCASRDRQLGAIMKAGGASTSKPLAH